MFESKEVHFQDSLLAGTSDLRYESSSKLVGRDSRRSPTKMDSPPTANNENGLPMLISCSLRSASSASTRCCQPLQETTAQESAAAETVLPSATRSKTKELFTCASALADAIDGNSWATTIQDTLFFAAHRKGMEAQQDGKFDEALNFYRQALKVKKGEVSRSSKPVKEAYAHTLYEIGIIQLETDPVKSHEAFHLCLELRQRLYGPDHTQVANVMFKLASLYSIMGEHQYALSLLLETHRIVSAEVEEAQEASLIAVWIAMGQTHRCLGQMEEACSSFEAAERLRRGWEYRAQ